MKCLKCLVSQPVGEEAGHTASSRAPRKLGGCWKSLRGLLVLGLHLHTELAGAVSFGTSSYFPLMGLPALCLCWSTELVLGSGEEYLVMVWRPVGSRTAQELATGPARLDCSN